MKKVSARWGLWTVISRVTEWETVEGVSLPRVTETTLGETGIQILVRHRFCSEDDTETNRKPAWANSSSIPGSADHSLEEWKQRTNDEQTDPSAFVGYINKYIREQKLYKRRKSYDVQAAIEVLENGRKRHPESLLIPEYLGVMYTLSDSYEELEKLVSEIQSKQDQTVSPFLLFLLARHHRENDEVEKMESRAKELLGEPVYETFARRLILLARLGEVVDPQTFLEHLSSHTDGDRVRDQLNVLSAVEPPFFNNSSSSTGGFNSRKRSRSGLLSEREVSFLRKLMDAAEAPAVNVLLARAFARNESYEEANRLYRSLYDLPFLRPEIKRFVKAADKNASWEFWHEFIDVLDDLEILHRYAVHSFENDHPEKGVTAAKRIMEVLRERIEKQKNEKWGAVDMDVETRTMKNLAEYLAEQKTEVLKPYLKYTIQTEEKVLERKPMKTLVKQTFGTPEEVVPNLEKKAQAAEKAYLIRQIANLYFTFDRVEDGIDFLRKKYRKKYNEYGRDNRKPISEWETLEMLTMEIMKLLKQRERYLEAIVVAERTLELLDSKYNRIANWKKKLKTYIDREKILNEFLSRSFEPPEKHEKKEIQELIDSLGAQERETREKAYNKLKKKRRTAIPLLKPHLDHRNSEVRDRIRKLLTTLAMQEKQNELGEKYTPDEN